MDTSVVNKLGGRYMVFGIGRNETPTMDRFITSSDNFNDALVAMSESQEMNPGKNHCIFDVVTQQFFDPGYVYSQAVAGAALEAISRFIGNKADG